jgi:glycosyltransferase involved in cell wall biosynthesis
MITVVIPVGPDPIYRKYLNEAILSVRAQTHMPDEILLIDDQAGLDYKTLPEIFAPWDIGRDHPEPPSMECYTLDSPGRQLALRVWQTPWLSGVAHSFNFGVALAANDLVFMMGSDDRLEPHCLEDCVAAYEASGKRPGYYWVDVQYSDGPQQALACNAAMVHKAMWRSSGGFPVESAVGPCDTMLLSILLAHPEAGTLIHVKSATPPYWYRRHDQTYSRIRGSKFGGVHGPIRSKVTELWQKPTWTESPTG